jgi:hypothetical protein
VLDKSGKKLLVLISTPSLHYSSTPIEFLMRKQKLFFMERDGDVFQGKENCRRKNGAGFP